MSYEFRIIAITPEQVYHSAEVEIKRLGYLLRNDGVDFVHVRHPRFSEDEMRIYLTECAARGILRSLTLHDHLHLAAEFPVGGVHLNSRNPEVPECLWGRLERKNLRISRSCHSLEEVKQSAAGRPPESCRDAGGQSRTLDIPGYCYSYVTLSPIFDSISKEGYKAAFDLREIEHCIRRWPIDVIALGGVTPSAFEELKSYGFGGAALLGYFFPKN